LAVSQPPITFAVLLASVLTVAFPAYSADTLNSIEVPGDRAYPESISAAPDGTLYVSSLASGGIARIKPGASKAEPWIKPGAFDSRSTFGVLVDERSNLSMATFTSIRLPRASFSASRRAKGGLGKSRGSRHRDH